MQEYILSPLIKELLTTDTMSKTTSLPTWLVFAENLVIFIRNRKVVKGLIIVLLFYVVFLWRLRNAGKNLVPAWL